MSWALKQMILPGLIAMSVSLGVGFFLGPETLGGFLAGATAIFAPLIR